MAFIAAAVVDVEVRVGPGTQDGNLRQDLARELPQNVLCHRPRGKSVTIFLKRASERCVGELGVPEALDSSLAPRQLQAPQSSSLRTRSSLREVVHPY
jgi:hypothetical protein